MVARNSRSSSDDNIEELAAAEKARLEAEVAAEKAKAAEDALAASPETAFGVRNERYGWTPEAVMDQGDHVVAVIKAPKGAK